MKTFNDQVLLMTFYKPFSMDKSLCTTKEQVALYL